MPKITAEQLKEAEGWSNFAKRLGWKFESVAHGWCVMTRMDQTIKLNAAMRADIERTWRDQGDNTIAGNVVEPIRSGTDG